MSCYLRHMHWLFDELGLAYDKAGRTVVDTAIREHLALASDAACGEVWARLKALPDDERSALVPEVRRRLV